MKEMIKKNRNLLLVVIDIMVIITCYLVSIFFLSIEITEVNTLIKEIAIAILVYEIFLNVFQMYRNIMQYEVGKDYVKYILSAFFTIIIISMCDFIFHFQYLILRLNVLSGVLAAGMLVMYRLAGRSILSRKMGFFANYYCYPKFDEGQVQYCRNY